MKETGKSLLQLDDDGLKILGNALLLGFRYRMIERERWPKDSRKYEQDLKEVSPRQALYSALINEEVLHPGFEPTLEEELEGAGRKLSDSHRRCAALCESEDQIATLRLKDIDFGRPAKGCKLAKLLEGASKFALRTPIFKIGATPLTFLLTRLVVRFFDHGVNGFAEANVDNENVDIGNDGVEEVSQPQDVPSKTAPKKKRRNSHDAYFQPAIEEALRLIREEGKPPKHHTLARIIVRQWGSVNFDEWTKDCGQVPGCHDKGAADNLALRLRKVFKELELID